MMEIYLSVDIEADGKIPGRNSMLSFGVAAFILKRYEGKAVDYERIGQFTRNLQLLEGAKQDPETMEFWDAHKEKYEAARKNALDPKQAMHELDQWLQGLGKHLVFVGWPATYDFLFLYWYMINFVGESRWSWSGLDIRSYAMGALKRHQYKGKKGDFPKSWMPERRHSHIAIDDAIEQGELFCRMVIWNENETCQAQMFDGEPGETALLRLDKNYKVR